MEVAQRMIYERERRESYVHKTEDKREFAKVGKAHHCTIKRGGGASYVGGGANEPISIRFQSTTKQQLLRSLCDPG